MPGFGPFSNYSDALLAACPFILDKPNATAGKPDDPNFRLRWQLSTEYCAWLYHTPAGNYEMSMLAQSVAQDNPRKRRCDLPETIDDPRYPSDSLGYLFVLHNHPFMDSLTEEDIRFIVSLGRIHGFEFKTSEHTIPISIVAFYSSSLEHPSHCGGFYQYAPLSGHIFKWVITAQGGWERQAIATVTWTSPESYILKKN